METPIQETQPTEVSAAPEEVKVESEVPQETAEQKAERERDGKGRFSKSPEERINEITRKMRETEREAGYWRQRAEAREKAETAAAEAKAVEEPKIEDFDSYDKYVKALAKHQAKQIVSETLTEREKAADEKSKAETRQKTVKERLEAAEKEIPDYRQVLESGQDTFLAEHVQEILHESDDFAKLLYYFAKNPAEADRLNGLSMTAAAREIGKIETTFVKAEKTEPEAEQAEKPTPTPPKKTTAAPAPAKPLGSGRSSQVNLATASMDEYMATRKTQGARWAR